MPEYLTYGEYERRGGGLSETEFPVALARASRIVDRVTMGRLREVDWSAWSADVAEAAWLAMEGLPAIDAERRARAAGQVVTSFSNGVNTLGFASDEAGRAAVAAVERAVADALPVELCSAAVGYNHGEAPRCW